jgi:hypothetical protein
MPRPRQRARTSRRAITKSRILPQGPRDRLSTDAFDLLHGRIDGLRQEIDYVRRRLDELHEAFGSHVNAAVPPAAPERRSALPRKRRAANQSGEEPD